MNVIHDLTPWKVAEATEKKGREIVAADGATIAKLTTLDLANAAMIVKAVNAYEGLVEALRSIRADAIHNDHSYVYNQVEAALAAAGEPV